MSLSAKTHHEPHCPACCCHVVDLWPTSLELTGCYVRNRQPRKSRSTERVGARATLLLDEDLVPPGARARRGRGIWRNHG
jgi:hypothetical protein